MASRNTGSASGSRSSSKGDGRDCKKIEEGEQASYLGGVSSTINQLKKQVQANRVAFVKEKIESNEKNLAGYTAYLQTQADSRRTMNLMEQGVTKDMLTLRIESALCKLSGLDPASGDKETVNCQEEGSSSTITFGSSSSGSSGKSIVRPIKLPFVEMIPPYTTWIFLDRNQRMTEDQSVVGRRRIYYDQYGKEALICSDSEEELAEEEDEKHEFTEGDDCVLQMTIQEYGQCQAVLNTLSQHIKAKPSEIEARFASLLAQDKEKQPSLENVSTAAESADFGDIFLGKDLDAALDSFDNLFCRRCLVFDCRLHGCSQGGLVLPSDKQSPCSNPEEDKKTPEDKKLQKTKRLQKTKSHVEFIVTYRH